MKWGTCFAALAALCLVAADAHAEKAAAGRAQRPGAAQRQDANAWTVGVAGGLLEGTFIRYAADLAKALDDPPNLRVLPMVTFGAVGNVKDLLNLRGVDVAITQADVLDHFRNEEAIPDIANRIQYISPLYNAEVHVYARKEFNSLKDLAGQKVAFNTPGSAANYTGEVIFKRLGVTVQPLLINNAIALEKMRSGEIAAVVHVVGKPNDLFAKFKPEPGFHFLPVEYDAKLSDYYVPATLDAADYPNLIPAGQSVQTVSVPSVLAVYNWKPGSERYRRVARFIEAYFAKFETMQQPPFQPKWQEVNLAGQVPGWTRYKLAEDALAKIRGPEAQAGDQAQLRSQFETFVTARNSGKPPLTESEREALFSAFVKWRGR
ncbi:C4-dicarboxylate ABC transporter [Alsobacter soli]|uniref:C4-dicarboxylate ABC transporter n=1 Tax=Alsobacter soli TaxID=2109933 RepID=A0A2T1HPM2_9HYPH|nr:TAXI family TRAP transporter solute-binding subunit [Alsobacter soli]PSC03600.1 C4-dicarboxylate ABC transporter [Alsobacter soli]